MVEKRKGGRERFEMFGDDSSTDLDDGELLRGDGAEVGEILLDLSLGSNVAQQLDDGGASGEAVGGSGILPS